MDDTEPATAAFVALSEMKAVSPNQWTEGPLFDLALRLERVKALRNHLNEVESWLELTLAERMEADEVPVEGVGLLKRARATRSSWKYEDSAEKMREDLANRVAEEVSLDVATGEYDEMKRNVARAAMRAAYEAIPSFSNLKVSGQRRLNIHIWDYRTTDYYYRVTLEGIHD